MAALGNQEGKAQLPVSPTLRRGGLFNIGPKRAGPVKDAGQECRRRGFPMQPALPACASYGLCFSGGREAPDRQPMGAMRLSQVDGMKNKPLDQYASAL